MIYLKGLEVYEILKTRKQEFEIITSEIINNDNFKKLACEDHHGINRYDHSLRVAKATYRVSKKMGLDYISATRAALLHDFFSNSDFNEMSQIKKSLIHPKLAANNAQKYFALNDKEKKAIETHMFPLTLNIPNSLEGLVVNIADTSVAIYECSRFKLNAAITLWLLFIFNILTFNNN